MPRYNFEDIKTKKVKEVEMKIAELDQYIKDHPELTQVFTCMPGLVSPYSVGRRKTDSRFRDRLKKISKEHPGTVARADNLVEV